ncbi:purine-cytosine permease family protein [Phytopseudomonas dryadis]|uniref:Allantoin permease n=1 Tax=Phytopseudomonas dryadis TaxID=2487520 RepID=A0ABY1ZBX4_9GAMM|nr:MULTISPECIES: allantoin permease [Pseudomonas]TBV09284.1 allantoin permease [Pseudomonas dryadis]TBV13002.1 allantoin permease [Pseudomonas sp. FRB 230]
MAALSQAKDENTGSANTSVSQESRMGRFSLTMAWWAVCSAVFYIVVGASLAISYGTINAIIGMMLSVVSYGIINAILSRHAIRSGESVALFSRRLFGSSGAGLATLIFFTTAIYYAVFEGSVIALAVHELFPSITYTMASLIVVLYSVPLVLGSVQRWLDKFNCVLLPIYLGGLFICIALSLYEYGYQPSWLTLGPDAPVANGWWHCFTYYMGVWVLMLYTYDYARFGKPEDAQYHGRWNFGMPFYLVTFSLNGVAGIYLVASIPHQGELSEISVVMAILKLMGLAGLLFVWATQTRINTANYYLATINMQSFFTKFGVKIDYVGWAIIVGVIVFGLMLADVFSYLLKALAYQGIFVVAWVGVALAYIAADRHSQALVAFDSKGLTAWFGATLAGLVLMSSDWSSLSAPATAVASFTLHYLLCKHAEGSVLASQR